MLQSVFYFYFTFLNLKSAAYKRERLMMSQCTYPVFHALASINNTNLILLKWSVVNCEMIDLFSKSYEKFTTVQWP